MSTVIKISRELHKSKNLAVVIKNVIINDATGGELKAGGAYCTDFVKVDVNKKYSISGIQSTASSFIALYDSNKNFIGRSAGNAKKEFIISQFDPARFSNGLGTKDYSDIKYLRVSNYLLAGQFIDMNNIMLQVEEGDTPTPYEPYGKTNKYLPRHLQNNRALIYGG